MEQEYDPVTGEEVTKKHREKKARYFDYSLLFAVAFIILLGFVLLYSASSYVAQTKTGNAAFYLIRQAIFTGVGVFVGVIIYFAVNYRLWKNFAKIIYWMSIVSVALIKTPLGVERNGARRWLGTESISFQPAEFVKLGVILMTAYMISKCGKNAIRNLKTVWKIFAMSGLAAGLVMVITSNLSSAIIIAAIPVVMLFVAGAPWKFFAQGGVLASVLLVVIMMVGKVKGNSFRSSRIKVWLNPEKYSDSGGFQVMQGLYAIGSGGLFGKGLGQSSQKMGFVPEAANDMVFSIVCEELGIFGAVAIMMLFAFMIWRMRIIASNAPDLFGSMVVVGMMAQISVQVVLNIAVVTNSIPNTGVSLPFISYGGTSLIFLIIGMAIVFSISKEVKRFR